MNSIKIGHISYDIVTDDPELNSRQRYGECINFPKPAIKVDLANNPHPEATLFHEIAHAAEGLLSADVLDDKLHTAYLHLFYMVLVENGFLDMGSAFPEADTGK